jgi:3-keto-disaccharide hydrolase
VKTRRIFLALASAFLAFADDAQFNGRWDIKVTNEPRNRVWWLEIQGAGTKEIKGKFVGAPGGQMDDIPEISIRDGELMFAFMRNYGRAQQGAKPSRGVYRARLDGRVLRGSFQVEGAESRLLWIGSRAPVLSEKDDGSWKSGKPVELFNAKDLTGWSAMVSGQPLGWEVKDGVTGNAGGSNNLVSDRKFWNFALHADYRVGAGSNGGIGLRGRYEVQILEDYGRPASNHGNGALYGRITPWVNASRKPGEWQALDIRLVGRDVTVVLNGTKIIDRQQVEGLTAMANDSNEAEPGPITLQGDHGPVEFKRLTVTPLVK